MEEFVGAIWHKLITQKADQPYSHAKVTFEQVAKSVGMVYRALGGIKAKRIEPAYTQDYQIRQTWLQKLARDNQQFSLAWQDEQSVRLPAELGIFNDIALNKSLYLWLAILAAHQQQPFRHWARDNQQLVVDILEQYPQLQKRYYLLAEAFVQLRAELVNPKTQAEQLLEQAIVQAILAPGSVRSFPAVDVAPAPVFLWLYPNAQLNTAQVSDNNAEFEQQTSTTEHSKTSKRVRKKAERTADANEKSGLMIFRLESLFSWSEMTKVDRGTDDSDTDENELQRTFDDLSQISLAKQQQRQQAGQLKVDLDLPSASEDDTVLTQGILLPEWDYKQQRLITDRCQLEVMLPKSASACPLPTRLTKSANKLSAQFEQLRAQRFWLKGQVQGEEIDLNAWLEHHVEQQLAPQPERGLYQSYRGQFRDFSCLLLADLSMSTDAHINDNQRVIDVIQDSLLLFAEALNSVGDPFAIYGFSSVKRQHIRYSLLKNFNENYNDDIRGRIQAIKPGFYTRMGAAIRQATQTLEKQQSAQKILLIVTDGKPNDIDHYEGRFGIEDTHQAIVEAQQAGLKPFCITIDQQAEQYLPYLFGSNGYTVIHQPEQLPFRLPQLYHQLTH